MFPIEIRVPLSPISVVVFGMAAVSLSQPNQPTNPRDAHDSDGSKHNAQLVLYSIYKFMASLILIETLLATLTATIYY